MLSTLKNNKGVSLIEMMVVIAIIAVVGGLAVLSFSLVRNADVAKSAETLKSSLAAAKSRSMAKGDANGKLSITKDGHNTYYVSVGGGDKMVLAKGGMKVYWAEVSVPVESLSGFSEVGNVDYAFNTAGMLSYINDPSVAADTSKVYEFAFRYRSSKRVSAVVLYPATGKTETRMWYEP